MGFKNSCLITLAEPHMQRFSQLFPGDAWRRAVNGGLLSSLLGFFPCSCDSTLGLGLADAHITVHYHSGTRGHDPERNTACRWESAWALTYTPVQRSSSVFFTRPYFLLFHSLEIISISREEQRSETTSERKYFNLYFYYF